MFFTKEEMKVAEKLAWENLDGLHHSDGYYDLKDYAYFYYKNCMIFDPWMNEKGQSLPWPDHEDTNVSVDPVFYYGEKTIENYLVVLFLLNKEYCPEIVNRIKAQTNQDGRLMQETEYMPIEVYFAMDERQAEEEHCGDCIENALPESERIYFEMTSLPENLVKVVEDGWEKEIQFYKGDAKKVMKLLYPNGTKYKYQKLINRIMGDTVRLIGFGD